jgi:hypothetical protein
MIDNVALGTGCGAVERFVFCAAGGNSVPLGIFEENVNLVTPA